MRSGKPADRGAWGTGSVTVRGNWLRGAGKLPRYLRVPLNGPGVDLFMAKDRQMFCGQLQTRTSGPSE